MRGKMDGQNFNGVPNNSDNQNQVTGGNFQNTNYYQDNTAAYTNAAYSAPVQNNDSGETPGLAIAGLVMGIISIVLVCCCGVGIIFGIAGLIMSIVANKNKKSGIGTAALVCSIIGLALNGLSLIYYILVGGGAFMEGFMEGLESV